MRDVHGHLADKDVWHGGIVMDAHVEARSHEWSLAGGGGAHWGKQDHTYLGWHVDLGLHLPLWRTTRALSREYDTLRLEVGANVGLDGGKLIEGVDTLAQLGGWHVGADLDFRFVGRTGPRDRLGYVMTYTLSITTHRAQRGLAVPRPADRGGSDRADDLLPRRRLLIHSSAATSSSGNRSAG